MRALLCSLALSSFLAPALFAGEAKKPATPAEAKDHVEFSIGPDYADAPELAVKPGVPRGEVKVFTMKSEDSKFYPGIAKGKPGVTPYQRQVGVYIPKQYQPGTPVAFIVAQDGMGYRGVLPSALDTLIHEKRVPIMVATSGLRLGQAVAEPLEDRQLHRHVLIAQTLVQLERIGNRHPRIVLTVLDQRRRARLLDVGHR